MGYRLEVLDAAILAPLPPDAVDEMAFFTVVRDTLDIETDEVKGHRLADVGSSGGNVLGGSKDKFVESWFELGIWEPIKVHGGYSGIVGHGYYPLRSAPQ